MHPGAFNFAASAKYAEPSSSVKHKTSLKGKLICKIRHGFHRVFERCGFALTCESIRRMKAVSSIFDLSCV